jgi:hypothetical protein
MNEGEREILRILNNPRLVTGEKADLVAQSLLGAAALHGAGDGGY